MWVYQVFNYVMVVWVILCLIGIVWALIPHKVDREAKINELLQRKYNDARMQAAALTTALNEAQMTLTRYERDTAQVEELMLRAEEIANELDQLRSK